MKTIPAKTILSGYTHHSSWFGENYTINLYRGCCHGCIYCDSRSLCYQIENFHEVRAKEEALPTLARELRSKKKRGVVGAGSMGDPYNPYEKRYRLTRGALKLIHQYGFGLSLATKSDFITRDIDIALAIQSHSPLILKITITTCDDDLSKRIEPYVAVSSKRFNAIESLSSHGLYAGILLMPILPFLTDTPENIRETIRLAYESGAHFIYPMFGVTLRERQREWFYKQLDSRFPTVKEKYSSAFGNSYMCLSPRAEELFALFKEECASHDLLYRMDDIIRSYKKRYKKEQLSLF